MKPSSPRPAASRSRRRSLAGLLVALAVLPVVLGTSACLQTPIGDPRHAWADPRLTGAWLAADSGDRDSPALWTFEPFDDTTWLVTAVSPAHAERPTAPDAPAAAAATTNPSAPPEEVVQTPQAPSPPSSADVARLLQAFADGGPVKAEIAVFRGWLVTIAGQRFLVLEQKLQPSTKRRFKPEAWWVFRCRVGDGVMTLDMIDFARDGFDKATTRGRAEALIAKHAGDPAFYKPFVALRSVPREQYDAVAAALQASGISG
jgi:hypothetical protein